MGFWIFVLVIGTVFLGMVGGAVVGGIAGYTVALGQRPEPMVISQPVPVSAEQTAVRPAAAAPEAPVVPENEALIAAVEKVKPATVTVLNFNLSGVTSGSGVIIDAAGYIVTNNHVVEGADKVEVILAHGGHVPAQMVGRTADFDLAVIKIDSDYVPGVARLGDSSVLRQGERVAAIGSALGGFRNTVTSGVISAHNRTLGGQRGLLQTDAPINHGNSGGPLVNLSGEVVGINVMVLRGSGFGSDVAEGLGFAIPSNTVKTVARQLIETGVAEMPFLGVSYSELNPQLSMEYGLSLSSGALIEQVLAETAAARAGLQPQDIIIAINDTPIDDRHPLSQVLMEHSVGEEVVLTVVRGEEQLQIPVTLGKRP
ncbi:MAG: PDZ domain-containing protein [Caldilineae bacterium]|nr:MAG: PDZ domain-containing protein [Caldilineae bacterium]